MKYKLQVAESIALILKNEYSIIESEENIPLQPTRPEFEGQITLTVFSISSKLKVSPEALANKIGNSLVDLGIVAKFNVVKGFLNLTLVNNTWVDILNEISGSECYGCQHSTNESPVVMVEFPSPNTNKPLHLGHLRNIFLGSAISEMLKATGHRVIHTCLYNDRGTNISKSMLAWMQDPNPKTPSSSGMKGDHLVGEYYVKYAIAYKSEIESLISQGISKEQAEKQCSLAVQVNELTVRWEKNDKEVRKLWETMNQWVYEGFNKTYQTLGLYPDKNYFESDVYNLGKETVQEGIDKGVFYRKEDGSVWIDLTADGLDEKVVLRSNGTTVYITQDLAIANEKDKDFNLDKSIYVVGNEQEYHFKVLFLILKKLGRKYADNLFHLSYGMVELPTGKMKSREGTVVDADDLIEEMIHQAKEKATDKGKLEGKTQEELDVLYKMVGLGALRYFILKVDPRKKMLFNPEESIEAEGHTGPFIQYTYARICSILRKSGSEKFSNITFEIANKISVLEIRLIQKMADFPFTLQEAVKTYNPSLIANYSYELAKEFNHYYHEVSILKEEDKSLLNFRLQLAAQIAKIIKQSMALLKIEVPESM